MFYSLVCLILAVSCALVLQLAPPQEEPFTPKMSTAVQVTKFDLGNPLSTIEVVQQDIPKPGPGQVVVNIKLRPCNPADFYSVMGVHGGFQPKGLPAVFGLEGTGVVHSLGEGASRFKVGDRVVFIPSPARLGSGSFQEYLAVAQEELAPVPEGVPEEAAAMALVNPMTIMGMMEAVAVPAGEYLLVTNAGSALSRWVIAYCRHLGIKTIGTVRRAEQIEEIKAEGADAVVCTSDEGWLAKVKEVTGPKGAYAALDSIAGPLMKQVCEAVRDKGTVVVYGTMGGLDFTGSAVDMLLRHITIRGFWVNVYLNEKTPEERQALMAKVMELFQKNVWKPYVGQKLPLAQAAQALGESMKDARGGKVLVHN